VKKQQLGAMPPQSFASVHASVVQLVASEHAASEVAQHA
jgi:hypothetical protein